MGTRRRDTTWDQAADANGARGWLAVVAVVGCAACGGRKDAPVPPSARPPPAEPAAVDEAPTCEQTIETVLDRFSNIAEREARDRTRAALVQTCQGEAWSDDMRRCIVRAADVRVAAACLPRPAESADEPVRYLDRLNLAADNYFAEHGAYPPGAAALTPSQPCCDFPGRRCPAEAGPWQQAPWTTLGFAIDEVHDFRLSYEGHGTSFEAHAVGDRDCDGDSVDYKLNGDASAGSPTSTLSKPVRGR
jgi:hypothetical protein